MIACRPFQKVRGVNSSSAAYPSLVCEIDLPLLYPDPLTAAGRTFVRLDVKSGDGAIPKWIEIWPYGLGNNNDTFSFRLIGWRRFRLIGATEPRQLFIPGIICDVACTMSAFTGLTGFPVLNTEAFCDTLTMTTAGQPSKMGNTTLFDGYIKSYSLVTADTPGRVQVPTEGFESLEFQWKQTLNTPTMNALYTFIDHPN